MILNIMKQTTNYYLEEKDYEVANLYADLYSQMILQYVGNRNQAIAALKDMAYEFFINKLYRASEKYYDLIGSNYDVSSLSDRDLYNLGTIKKKLNNLSQSMICFQRIVRFFPESALAKKSYEKLSEIFIECNNKNQARIFKRLAKNDNKISKTSHSLKSVKKLHKEARKAI